jgi:hypothetical protein
VPTREPLERLDEPVEPTPSGNQPDQSAAGLGDPAIVSLIRRAIVDCSQIQGVYEEDSGDEPRVFCPAALGTLYGDRHVLVMQISGESSSGYEKGLERCLKVAKLHRVRLREGPWFPIEGDLREATCFKYGAIESYSRCLRDPERDEEAAMGEGSAAGSRAGSRYPSTNSD